MLHAVIMAGGSGTRFWPLSRKACPKQLLNLTGNQTLLQQTVERAQSCVPSGNVWMATGEHLVEPIRQQLPTLSSHRMIIEPCGRNTAPCIGLAAIQLLAQDPEAEMLILPSDHLIEPVEQFADAVSQGQKLLAEDPQRFILFGAKPTFPSTGFGYIERGEPCELKTETTFKVATFREKPDEATAQSYLDSGAFYWNCGIFLWRAETVLKAIQKHQPGLYQHLQKLQSAVGTSEWSATLQAEFPRMPSISIDYAVLEKAKNVCVIEAPFNWDDLGSWKALRRLLKTDSHGNIIQGKQIGTSENSILYSSQPDHLLATIGLKDLLVVHTDEVTLIARNDDEHALKELLAQLAQDKQHERYL